jgi:YVTN family beta-propeller protein
VDSDFQIFSRESLCLFAQWDVDNSIEDKHLFAPKLTVEPQGMAIENILAYVSNEASNCVTIIDRQEDEVVGTIAVGKAPRGITARRDRATVAGKRIIRLTQTLHVRNAISPMRKYRRAVNVTGCLIQK